MRAHSCLCAVPCFAQNTTDAGNRNLYVNLPKDELYYFAWGANENVGLVDILGPNVEKQVRTLVQLSCDAVSVNTAC